MEPSNPLNSPDLAAKIARLVEERGWNQEDFARATRLNRQTVRSILQGGDESHRLRNATVSACARGLGLSVSELRSTPLDRLLPRMRGEAPPPEPLQRLKEQTTQPELSHWIEQHPERAGRLTAEEVEELLSLQGVGGPLTSHGVEFFVDRMERRRRLIAQVQVVAGTEYLGLLEQLIGLIYDKVQPYAHRPLLISRLDEPPRPASR